MKKRTEQDWNAVYDILVREAGAQEEDRESFVFQHCREHIHEWRFQGKLGFGGKLWVGADGNLHVSCYTEDVSPERGVIIKATNAALARC